MLNWVIDFSLRHRFSVILAATVFAVAGALSLRYLDIDAFPDTTPVQVQINTVAPALGPEEVEQRITFPVEQAIGGLPGLEQMRSVSKFGFSQVVAIFEEGMNQLQRMAEGQPDYDVTDEPREITLRATAGYERYLEVRDRRELPSVLGRRMLRSVARRLPHVSPGRGRLLDLSWNRRGRYASTVAMPLDEVDGGVARGERFTEVEADYSLTTV